MIDHNHLVTLKDYAQDCLPKNIVQNFTNLYSLHRAGTISSIQYEDAMNKFVMCYFTDDVIGSFTKALCKDFRIGNFVMTRHFAARLLTRFSESVMSFLMARIKLLLDYCCKNKKERCLRHGIMLVVDPLTRTLITIYVR